MAYTIIQCIQCIHCVPSVIQILYTVCKHRDCLVLIFSQSLRVTSIVPHHRTDQNVELISLTCQNFEPSKENSLLKKIGDCQR